MRGVSSLCELWYLLLSCPPVHEADRSVLYISEPATPGQRSARSAEGPAKPVRY
jgi:hypothetical protein